MIDKKARIAIQKLAEEINYEVNFAFGSLNKFAPFVNFKGGDCFKGKEETKQKRRISELEETVERLEQFIENNTQLFELFNEKVEALENYLKIEMKENYLKVETKENYYIKKTNG